MQPKEQPLSTPKESWPGGLPRVEDALAKEKVTLKKLGTHVADIVRDIGTANEMAKDKFEGDSALMHIARGAVTSAVGAGLEKSMDYVWDSIWQGKIPYYDKARFGEGMAEDLNKFALQNPLKARLAYLMKEGTQDLSVAVFYNFLAFRSQPILPKAEPKHLVASLGADVLEAFLSPTLPNQVQGNAVKGNQDILRNNIETLEEKKEDYAGRLRWNKGTALNDYSKQINTIQQQIQAKTKMFEDSPVISYQKPSRVEEILRGMSKISNPVTMLGAEWMASGVKTLIENFKLVQKVRKEHGGMEGKKVVVVKKNDWHDRGERKPYNEKSNYNKDKVYYGKSQWNPKEQEEYELKGA